MAIALPPDYLRHVYAGVLGKLVGVYLGRPFENWTYEEIQNKLGDIRYYVHDKLSLPLVVIDDDVSGTFSFVRALDEHGCRSGISSEQIGKTWLNKVIEQRTVFWWGGNGISTEHTAFLNLKKGIPGPQCGSVDMNGRTISEQIGAQIFIDGWAMVAPGNPKLAAQLAEAAARVSHDGEAVLAAKLWAAMEAEAFISKDIDHLLNIGLGCIASESIVARMIADVRAWVAQDKDWRRTRQRIQDHYGYDKYLGVCHIVPNHAIMIMAILYGGHDFHEAMHIINTCGWDTDCNSGNVASLVAIMHGISAFDGGPDWLGPLADRAIISSADGGFSINNATRIAYDIANLGCKLAGEPEFSPPKDGAQFHFSLPGGVQGFQSSSHDVRVRQVQGDDAGELAIELEDSQSAEVMTNTFIPREILGVDRNYGIMASPLVYPGQRIRAQVRAASDCASPLDVLLRIKAYNKNDALETVDDSPYTLEPGQKTTLEWTVPERLQNMPIQAVGLSISAPSALKGAVLVDSLRWDGIPTMTLKKPRCGSNEFWHGAWVSSVDKVQKTMNPSFLVAQDRGEGILVQGTREWTDYTVTVTDVAVHLGASTGVVARMQGLNRYYAVVFSEGDRLCLIKAADAKREELASVAFDWQTDIKYDVVFTVQEGNLRARVGEVQVTATDSAYTGGAMGLLVTEGAMSASSITVSPVNV